MKSACDTKAESGGLDPDYRSASGDTVFVLRQL